ncbi:MAG: membrane fusion protein (multidrug efflux system) [Cyclobacteriaceae bacterium]|jgi:membrane fusion protein (multidrug efflux system)
MKYIFTNTSIMKRTLLTLTTVVGILLTSCGGKETTMDLVSSGDLASIHARKKELSDQQRVLNDEIAILDSVISSKQGDKRLPLVTTINTKLQRFEHFIELQGGVTTKQNVLIYPEAAGILLKVYVTEGQKVKRGQLLASVDEGGTRSQLEQLKTQMALSKTTYERQTRLWDQKIGTEIQFLQSKSAFETQQSAVNQLESQLDKYKITAPFSGIIDEVIKDQGTVVSPGPGSEVFRIINLSDMYIDVSVPETYISTVTVGKEVKVYIPVLDNTVLSKVRQTGNYINPNNRSFNVQVAVPNPKEQIKPNMTVKVLINDYLNESVILIPQSIISENAEGEQYVFLADNINADNEGNARKSIIKTGKTQGDYVEVLAGIKAGANIIQEGARSVKDGQGVKILTNN